MNIAIIPARGGSQRIPRKNIKRFKGSPMIFWAIDVAYNSGLFHKIVVSTEDDEIAEVSKRAGAEILTRPPCLAEDSIGTQDVAKHALESEFMSHLEEYKYACVIYPCVPLVESRDLIDSMERLISMPQYHYCYSTYLNGQDCGAFYWGRTASFTDRVPLEENSIFYPLNYACDINTMDDWVHAEKLFEERYGV
jgi:CMP-N-acetylneuraminic acid synthetase